MLLTMPADALVQGMHVGTVCIVYRDKEPQCAERLLAGQS